MDFATQKDAGSDRSVLGSEKPAIGVPAGHLDPDALARVVLRALGSGYTVLLAYEDRSTIERLDIPGSLGVIPIPFAGELPDTSPIEALAEAARAYGFPGLIYHEGADPIDYERTAKHFVANGYVTRATTESKLRDARTETVCVVPAYNEASTIASVVLAATKHVDEVFVIDDGSDDDTVSRAKTAGATVIEHGENRGYGAALKTGFRVAAENGAKQLVVLDGDGQHDPDDIPELLAKQRQSGAEIVIGSRFLGDARTQMPAYRRVGLGTINVLTNLSLGVVRRESWVSDTQSGFRVYGERAIGTLANDDTIGDHMEASTDILYHAHHHDHEITEVGIEINYDVSEGNSHHPLVHGAVLLSNILRTIERERPITMLGLPGFALVALGFVAGYGTVANFASTGTLPFASAFLAAGLLFLGVLACFTSLVLHSINTHLYPLERQQRGGSGSG
jgi:hypothetical protein